jgi:UDP-N-acetylmuramyl pentapeptide synthase
MKRVWPWPAQGGQMTDAPGAVFSDYWSDWGRSGGVVITAEGTFPWEIPSMAPRDIDTALAQLRQELAAGRSAEAAVGLLSAFTPQAHVLEVRHLSGGIVLIDDTATTIANDAVSSLKAVTSVAARQRRVIVVAGALNFDGDSDYDTLGSYGALMVRLNVDQVFAVGADARALFLSVGMEGSWDGESQHCLTLEDAYDKTRAFLRPEDVVLVMGSVRLSLLPLVEALGEDLS